MSNTFPCLSLPRNVSGELQLRLCYVLPKGEEGRAHLRA